MAQVSKKKNHNNHKKRSERAPQQAQRVSALGKHMERAKHKKRKS